MNACKKSGVFSRLGVGLCIALLLPASAFGAELGIWPGTELARLLNKPQVIASSIEAETLGDGSYWIAMDVDVHVFTDKPFESLRALTEGLEQYPRIFKRLKKARVTRSGGELFFEMAVSVGLMGVTYDTDYTMRVTTPLNSPARFMLDCTWYAGDGLVRDDARGQWYLESVSADGIRGTYIRYIVHGVVLKKYPLQEEIMRLFVNLEHIDLMEQFLRAATKAAK